MAVPTFLASSHIYRQLPTVTDVATIITEWRDLVLNDLSTPWTEPSAGLFRSPADASGRYMDVELIADSATALSWRVIRSDGTVICDRSIQIDAGGTNVDLYAGQFHAVIDALRATAETAWAFILDLSPQGQTSHPNWLVANAYRNAVGSVDTVGSQWSQFFAQDNGVVGNRNRGIVEVPVSGETIPAIRPDGAIEVSPAEVAGNMSGSDRKLGRLYQAYKVPNTIAQSSDHVFPIDVGVSANFRVIGCGQNQGAVPYFLAVRK